MIPPMHTDFMTASQHGEAINLMSDPAIFTVDGVSFKALPARQGAYYFWRPSIDGVALSIVKLPSGERPYAVNRVNYASLEAAARGAIERRSKDIEQWRKSIAEYDAAMAILINAQVQRIQGDQ